MSVILSQSEHNDQQAAGMVLAGDLTIPTGSHLRASGMVSIEDGTLTIEDGAILEIDAQPPRPTAASSSKVVLKVGDTPRSLLPDASNAGALTLIALNPNKEPITLKADDTPRSLLDTARAGGWYERMNRVDGERLLAEITGTPALLGASNAAAVGDTHARVRAMFTGSPALIDGNTLADNALRNWYTASDKLIDAKVLTALDGLSAQMGEVLRQQLMQPISLAAAEQVQQMLSVTGSAMASSLQSAIEPLARQMTQAITLPIRQSYLETISSVAGMVSSFEQVSAIAQRYAQFESTALAAGSVVSGLPLPIREPYVLTGTWQAFDPDMPVAQRQRRPPAQPAAPDWREALTVALKEGRASLIEVITVALREGRASPQEVIALLHGMNLPGQKPARWTEIEALALAYQKRGSKYDSLEHFARAMGYSRATAHRYLSQYQTVTGKQILPGVKGSRKRRN